MDFIDVRLHRLERLKEERPQFAEVFTFYQHLYRFLAGERETGFLRISPPEERPKDSPLLSGIDISPNQAETTDFLLRLMEVLKEHGHQGQEDLTALQTALQEGRLDLGSLFTACLERNRLTLHENARAAGAPAALLEFVLDMALTFALQKSREEGLGVPTEGWSHGYCPLCGGLPAMGELKGEEGKKILHCGTCGTSWPHPRLRCSYCGNGDPKDLEYFTAQGEKAHRVNVCRQCSCYLKVVQTRPGEEFPMDIEDISTIHLDLLAQKEGFSRGKKES